MSAAKPIAEADRARDALWSLDPNAPRDEWVRIGCAAKAAGLSLEDFNDWSATAANYGGLSDTKSAWRSFKIGGGINAGTLFHKARAAGWSDPQADRTPEKPTKKTDPRKFWDDGQAAPADHRYISSKQGTPDGLRVVSWPLRGWGAFKGQSLEGWLMVPVWAGNGSLASIQFISPNGEKLNAPRCSLAGTFTVGTIESGEPAYIVEGIGHAWSVHELTGRAAVVSFGASNTQRAAKAIRDQGANPVIVADRGKEREAQQAAAKVGCWFVLMPETLPDGEDINDLCVAYNRKDEARALLVNPAQPTANAAELRPANDNRPIDIHDAPEVPFMTWPDISSKGNPLNTIPNLERLLVHYGFNVRYDVIKKDICITYPSQNGTRDNHRSAAINVVTSLAAKNNMPQSRVPDYLVNVADKNQYNPVMDWITVKPWDGKSRLEALADTIQTRPDYDRGLFHLLLKRWLVSAVAAAAMPNGFRSKGVLTLQGAQSIGKTAWFTALVPDEHRDLLKVDALIDTNNKDTVISAVSHWLVELGELDGTFRKSDIAKLKGFISADADKFRRPYGRTEEDYPRKTVFFASVNDDSFLVDESGNKRWWTVPATRINYQHGIDMQQLWAEVFALYQSGERWWLTPDEEARLENFNDGHRRTDTVEELILSRYNREAPATRSMTATEVLLEIGIDRPTNAQAQKAALVLSREFGDRRRVKGRNVYTVPPLIYDRMNDRPY